MRAVVSAAALGLLGLLGLLGPAGCFAPAATTGVPCAPLSSEVRCPDGQVCIAHDGIETCESNGSDTPPELDRDRDGVIDAVDNCPDVANTDQNDEERDGLGDVCDPCPPFDGNGDADGDSVGDACDPNPDTPGDTLVAFEGFARQLPASWTTSGLFLVAAGEAFAMAGPDESVIASLPSPPTKRVEIRAAGTFVANNAVMDNLGAVNLVERLAPNTDKGVACQLSGLIDGTEQQLRIFDLDAGTIVNTAPHVLQIGTELELRLRRNETTYSCRATSPVLEIAGTSAFSPMTPRIGLRARSVDVLFHWVMIVSSP